MVSDVLSMKYNFLLYAFNVIYLSDVLVMEYNVILQHDRELNQKKEVCTKKIKMLPYVCNQLKKSDLHGIFLESGILSAMTVCNCSIK